MIYELFSKRQSDAAKSGQADVYQYDTIPQPLRVQVDQIARDAIGQAGVRGDGILRGDQENPRWTGIERIYRREKGLDPIAGGYFAGQRVLTFMRNCPTEGWLDLLEIISTTIIAIEIDRDYQHRHEWRITVTAKDAIDEINHRLREAGVGYQIVANKLMRVDSQFIHAEIVKPALELLSGRDFEGPRQEFLSAHQHYRVGDYRQAVAMAANALESTFKAIFDKKKWDYKKGARISDLVKVAKENRLWPDYLDLSFDQLTATLQSGLPKIRDNDAAHGQGAKPKEVPGYIAAYALHLAACKIVFIAEAAKG